ncbi:hypothetical protein ABZ192_39655 [Streptomyces sp. NPDC006235]|uniref:hypothetical protein n=1 Tax=Streptomyces sp. NPDC006235 TaxID=3156736 RepID=UPI0033A0E71C
MAEDRNQKVAVSIAVTGLLAAAPLGDRGSKQPHGHHPYLLSAAAVAFQGTEDRNVISVDEHRQTADT